MVPVEEAAFLIVDADTGAHLPEVRYRFYGPLGKPLGAWKPVGVGGLAQVQVMGGFGPRTVEFEAEGYRSQLFELLFPEKSQIVVRLHRPRQLHVRIVNPDGTPATNAQVRISGNDHALGLEPALSLQHRRMVRRDGRGWSEPAPDGVEAVVTHLFSDSRGGVLLTWDSPELVGVMRDSPPMESFLLLAVSSNGFAATPMVAQTQDQREVVELLPWCTVEGRLTHHGKPLPHQPVLITLEGSEEMGSLRSLRWLAMSDPGGFFRFRDVPPGTRRLLPTLPDRAPNAQAGDWRSAGGRGVKLRPGRTNVVDLDIGGAAVTGVAAVSDAGLATRELLVELLPRDPEARANNPSLTFIGHARRVTGGSTSVGGASRSMVCASGATYWFEDVAAGDYILEARENVPFNRRFDAPGQLVPFPVYRTELTVDVSAARDGRTINLGSQPLAPAKPGRSAGAPIPGLGEQ